jgi:hypothetical protein
MKKILFFCILACVALLVSCSIQFKMNGTSIDYSVTRTISIADFPNMAPMVYPFLEPTFNEALRDIYARQTRLIQVPQNGDLQLEGEITQYDLAPLSIQSDAFASETRLTIAVKVRFKNTKNPKEDFEQVFSANDKFPSDRLLADVQDELITTIIAEITENIFNRTVANW